MSQEGKPDFYTQKGYQMRSQHALTGAMEDYLEMICRQAEADGCARIGLLAEGSTCVLLRPPRWCISSARWGWWPLKSTA